MTSLIFLFKFHLVRTYMHLGNKELDAPESYQPLHWTAVVMGWGRIEEGLSNFHTQVVACVSGFNFIHPWCKLFKFVIILILLPLSVMDFW